MRWRQGNGGFGQRLPGVRHAVDTFGASSLARFSMNSSLCVSLISLLADAIPEHDVLACQFACLQRAASPTKPAIVLT